MGKKVRFRCVKSGSILQATPWAARHAPASSHWLHAIVLKLNDEADPLALSRAPARALPTLAPFPRPPSSTLLLLCPPLTAGSCRPLTPLALSAVTCTRATNHMPRIVGDVARTSSLSKVPTGDIARTWLVRENSAFAAWPRVGLAGREEMRGGERWVVIRNFQGSRRITLGPRYKRGTAVCKSIITSRAF